MSALAELAVNTEKMFRVRCEFDCPEVVNFNDHAAATHLFRIAQEAVSNAIKHGKAKNISIQLRETPDDISPAGDATMAPVFRKNFPAAPAWACASCKRASAWWAAR